MRQALLSKVDFYSTLTLYTNTYRPAVPNMYPAKFVHREAWGALEAKDEMFLPHPIQGFILTYTDTPRCLNKRQCYETVQAIQLRDMNRGYHDIRYK